MITDYFNYKPLSIVKEYYELHRSFIERNNFKKLYDEVKQNLVLNSTRQSCVCISAEHRKDFTLYNLPLIDWTNAINNIRNKILIEQEQSAIDYGLVHYYPDNTSNISWHSDREAIRSNIYSISIGGTRRFCLRDKQTKKILTFDLYDGDLFIMKVGCQNKFEHCIKSIKSFNEPRISITFRQIEKAICYFTFDYRELLINMTNEKPKNANYTEITKTKQGIIIGYLKYDNEKEFEDYNINTSRQSSLLKSNIQKAIRRKIENVALETTIKMITGGQSVDLLRRLTIISFEDVQITKYYPVILWYYIALTCGYKLLEKDVIFIYSYVKMLCSNNNNIHDFSKIKTNISSTYELQHLINDTICVSLYLRTQFGGFNCEIDLINYIIDCILNNKYSICNDNIELLNYKININESITILDCAIDFHCFPKMPEKVLAMIGVDKGFTEDDVRSYIWQCDSSINSRLNNSIKNDELNDVWINIIKPKCDTYRYYIKKIINV